ncbi:MAG: FtsX-like permease family protein [Rhodothermia bacterium]|nr:FtsX-like permease family protein [Rhodothermia bacterium]
MLTARISRRYLLRHPWLLLLSVVGVAVGVAVVVAIDIANSSSSKAFSLSADAVAGSATHQIVGPDGTISDSVYTKLVLSTPGVIAAPVVEGYLRIAECERRVFQVMGIDPLRDGEVRGYTGEGSIDLAAMLTRPAIALSADVAADCGITAGDWIRVDVGGVDAKLLVASLIEPDDERSAAALETVVVADISTAQELFSLERSLSRVDLVVPEGDDLGLERLTSSLPSGVVVKRSDARTETLAQMTRAFDVNLRALSLLALVVGMFLIYNSMTFSVVQRRPLIGRLRALGMTRREIFALVSGEAAVIGVAGTLVGMVLGVSLATVLVDLVTRTINDLYFAVTVSEIDIGFESIAKGVGLGVGVTLLAALRPAWEATAVPVTVTLQRSAAESTAHRFAGRFAIASVGIAVCAGAVLYATERSIVLSYVGLLLVILAFVAAAPALVLVGTRILRPILHRMFGVIGTMASNAVGVSLTRTGVAIAALMVAVSATIGVGVMVGSFRTTVVQWLGYSLQADIYIQAPSVVVRKGDTLLRPDAVAAVRNTSGVREIYTVATVDAETNLGSVDAVVIEPGPMTPETFVLKEERDEVWEELVERDVIIVSEPFSFRYGVNRGDDVIVQTESGPRPFNVAGVYYDYGSDLGAILYSRAVYERHFSDPGVNGMALYVDDSTSVESVIEDVRRSTSEFQELYIQSNRSLRSRSLEIFDRTFVVTGVLRLLTIVVAFIGVLSALMALQLEKSRELAVMRANGMTPGQLWGFVTLQTAVMGLLAGLLAVPLGLSLAALLVFVINKRSFGWTLQFEPTPEAVGVAILLAVLAALIAGLYPAWKMSQTRPSEALRRE